MLGLPSIASAHGYEVDQLIIMIHWLMLALFIGWGIYFVVVLFKFRQKKHPHTNTVDYVGYKGHFTSVVEVAVVVIEAALLIGFSIPFWSKQVNAFPDRTDTVQVRVVAEQFAWNIHYPGKDGVFGKTNPKLIDNQTNPIGIDLSDPKAADDIININQMHLPVGRPAVIHLSSKDVIHSFGINAMRVKQDTLPGLSIKTWFTPTKVNPKMITVKDLKGMGRNPQELFDLLVANGYIDQMGKITDQFKTVQAPADLKLNDKFKRYAAPVYGVLRLALAHEITCSQLCGVGHYRMKGFVVIDTPEEFEKWMSAQATAGSASGESSEDSFWN
jgi:cytochrome c oxidase subunit II